MPDFLPFISFMCPTYGRVGLLAEAIESFHKQNYTGKKELIILNDCPDIKLYYEHPEVKLFNLDKRFPSFGHKLNTLVELCEGDLIEWLADDDIIMPWMLETQTLHASSRQKELGLIWTSGCVELLYEDGKEEKIDVRFLMGGGPAQIIFSKERWEDIGRYQEGLDFSQEDVIAYNRYKQKGILELVKIPIEKYFYLWRRSISKYNFCDTYGFYQSMKVDESLFGEHYLQPSWKKNYISFFNQLINGFKKNLPRGFQTNSV